MSKRKLILISACVALTGCSPRPPAEVLAPQPVQEVAGAKTVRILAATTRGRLADKPYAFGADRANHLSYAAFDMSIPPDHKRGQIEWPDGPPNAATDFVTTRQQIMSRAAFAQADRGKDVSVYVHGYNYSFQEALFRATQLGADASLTSSPILFSWPSEGRTAAYLADRDGADYSRDGLVELLEMLVRDRPGGGQVRVLAHSMGARLTMEALRQMRLQGKGAVLDRLEIILAAPDIDIDVFREQLGVVGKMKDPITILVASDDKALALSSRLSAGRKRLGAIDIENPAVRRAIDGSGVRVIDISDIQTNTIAHDRYVDLVGLYPQVGQEGPTNPINGVFGAGAFVFNTVGATLSSIGGALSD